MIRTALAFSSIFFMSACMEASERSTNYTNDPVPIPDPIIIVGEAGPVAMAAAELRADGINVQTSPIGRVAGLDAFCSGQADAMALTNGKDWTSAERDRCRELKDGWGWSAFSTKNGNGFYIRFGYSQDLLDRQRRS